MDKRLHLLESFDARGSDGRTYKVFGYEHLLRDESVPNAIERWEPSGVTEYRLDDGTVVLPTSEGALRVSRTGVELARV
ncbi:MAG TPA: hypothetical protein VFP68_00305 [Burkholderiaceae bacterium]|nr:hypothetical protein [Burkholderiaceae bacterium]